MPMIHKILGQIIEALSPEDLIEGQSASKRKTVYIFLQVLSILPVGIWTSTGVATYFIGMLLNPRSTLLEWSGHHKILIVAICSVFLTLPTTILYLLSTSLSTAAAKWYEPKKLSVMSPVIMWILTTIFILFPSVFLMAFIATFYHS